MVGNDIVDLSDPETRTGACHSRFDERVFAPAELEVLAAARSRERMRWILWSAKEAAYKAARRARATTVFSPSRFVVRLDDALGGFVHHDSRRWNVHVQLSGDCVHAVVNDDTTRGDAIWGARRTTDEDVGDPSAAVRRFAATEIAARLGMPVERLRIECPARIPRLVIADAAPPAELSLSHHGSFVGFACRIEPAWSVVH